MRLTLSAPKDPTSPPGFRRFTSSVITEQREGASSKPGLVCHVHRVSASAGLHLMNLTLIFYTVAPYRDEDVAEAVQLLYLSPWFKFGEIRWFTNGFWV